MGSRSLVRGCSAALALAAAAAPPARAQDAVPELPPGEQLLAQAFDNLYGSDFVTVVKMITRRRGGRPFTRELQIVRRQEPEPGKALVRFLAPENVRDTAMLVVESHENHDDIYIYLPALRRTRHLAASQRGDPFFGTDFTYEDLEPKRAEDYEAKTLGSGQVGSIPCARVEVRAREGFESHYERSVSCIDQTTGVILATDFYRHGRLFKRLEVDTASIRAVGPRHVPYRMRLETGEGRSDTSVETESYELRDDIPDSVFTVVNLESGSATKDRRPAR